jgi:acyl carrier protein
MQREEIISAVGDALAEVLQRESVETTDDMRLFEDLHLDSTSVLTLLMAMEDSLGVEADPESLNMDDFRTVGTFADWIAANLPVRA